MRIRIERKEYLRNGKPTLFFVAVFYTPDGAPLTQSALFDWRVDAMGSVNRLFGRDDHSWRRDGDVWTLDV